MSLNSGSEEFQTYILVIVPLSGCMSLNHCLGVSEVWTLDHDTCQGDYHEGGWRGLALEDFVFSSSFHSHPASEDE